MIRKTIHSINDVFDRVINIDSPDTKNKKKSRMDFYGDRIKMGSYRLQLFKQQKPICVNCGLKGEYFAKEKHRIKDNYHLNLYALTNKGEEILITKDHIKPKSKGGKNHISNYQVMCSPCNIKKGSEIG